jgi:dipeptidyl aminopeptidase/acylaminoacyl peptidase
VLNQSRHEQNHAWPYFLPDGDHFLFLARTSEVENNALMVGSLSSKEVKFVINAHSRAAYDPSGYLLFVRERSLMAQPFDARKLLVTGDAFPIAEQLEYNPSTGGAAFTASFNGLLAYRTGMNSSSTRLTWFDRAGKPLNSLGSVATQRFPELSPDGKRVAIERIDPQKQTSDIWVIETDRDLSTPLTFDPANDRYPGWSPDGAQIVFTSDRNQAQGLYVKPSSGAGTEQLVLKTDAADPSWSADGKFVVFRNGGAQEIFQLPLSGERQPVSYLKSQFTKRHAKLSPDGRWLAYASDESGKYEVYVQSFPNPTAKWKISIQGGEGPRWRHDGKELFYLAPDEKLMAVPIRPNPTAFEFSTAVPLFEIRTNAPRAIARPEYDVSPDGQRFLVNTLVGESSDTPITVVVNWTAALNKK